MTSNIDDLNKKLLDLACAVHGLDPGDTRALQTYEMIKAWLKENAAEVLEQL